MCCCWHMMPWLLKLFIFTNQIIKSMLLIGYETNRIHSCKLRETKASVFVGMFYTKKYSKCLSLVVFKALNVSQYFVERQSQDKKSQLKLSNPHGGKIFLVKDLPCHSQNSRWFLILAFVFSNSELSENFQQCF